MTPVLRIRATRRTVSHSCCRYFCKHIDRSNTPLSSHSVIWSRTQHRTWRLPAAPSPPAPASWSLPCRWRPATLHSGLLSIDHSWTTAWEWLPARTHNRSHCQLGATGGSQNTSKNQGLTRFSCRIVLYVIFAVAWRPLWRQTCAMKSVFISLYTLKKTTDQIKLNFRHLHPCSMSPGEKELGKVSLDRFH